MTHLRARRGASLFIAAATACSVLVLAPMAGAAPVDPAAPDTTVPVDPATPDTAVPVDPAAPDTTVLAPEATPIDPATVTVAPIDPAEPAAPVDPLATTDASTTDAVTAAAAGCTVSAILVPSCGAWLGASTAAKSGKLGSSDYVIGLNEYEAVAGNQPDILHFYKSGASKFPNAAEIGMAERPGKQRSILYYNWKPGGTWKAVASGAANSAIQTVAANVKKYPHKIFMTIEHEPEADVGDPGKSAADFVAMFRYVVNRMEKTHGVTNVVWVMNYMGYNSWSSLFDPLYPGNDYVDWIAYDPYGFKMHTDYGLFLDTPKGTTFKGFYSWATKKAPGKPIMLGEWGFDLNRQPKSPAILDGATAIIQARFPMLKALVYWNDDAGGFSVRLDQNTTLGRAYGAAYRRMANQSYFNLTSTAAAP